MALSDELIANTRVSGFLPDAHPDYTDARILKELSHAQLTVFGHTVVQARGGHWRDESLVATTAGKAVYRIPGRAIAGGLERIEIANGTGGGWDSMTETVPYHAGSLSGPSGNPTRGVPTHYVVDGDQIHLYPAPDSASYTLKMLYYRRPSRLVEQQVTGTERGRITAVDTDARTIEVNAIPFDQELSTPAAITSGQQAIDVIHPDGWHEVALTSASQTYSGTTITVGGTLDMTKVEVGDYVRAAEQSDWAALPEDFERTLADSAAVVILTSLGATQKAGALATKMGEDLRRFRSLLRPRVKDSPRIIRASQGFLFGRRRAWPVNYS